MDRFRFSEMSSGRIQSAILSRVADLPHSISWHFHPFARQNKIRIHRFRGKHSGERCFLIANGQSLNDMDLSFLKNEITFGLNRIYLLFKTLEFQTTYFVSVNALVLEQFRDDIFNLNMPKFINWNKRRLFGVDSADTIYFRLRLSLRDSFSPNMMNPLFGGGTVTFVTLQIAYYMGFNQVFIIGLDHHYNDTRVPGEIIESRSDVDQDHFHPQYFPKGIRWQAPDLLRSDAAYSIAKENYENDGREILDATLNGHCQVFKKVNYTSLF